VHSWIVDLVVAFVVVVAGIFAYRFKTIQRVAVGWIAVSNPDPDLGAWHFDQISTPLTVPKTMLLRD